MSGRTRLVVAASLTLAAAALAQPAPVAPAPAGGSSAPVAGVPGVPDLAPLWPPLAETEAVGPSAVRRLEWSGHHWRTPRLATPLTPKDEDLADARALLKPGIAPEAAQFEFEREGGQIARPGVARQNEPPLRHGAAGEPAALYVHVAALPAPGSTAVPVERTWFAYYPPGAKRKTPAADARGLIVLMPGLLGTPEPVIEVTVQQMRRRGYAVLRMLAQPSRFLESAAVDAADEARRPEAARAIADLLTRRTAACAYAVEGTTARLLADVPELARKPRVILGMSGGAMTLPPVVARRPDDYAAAVLVAGGANFLSICTESNYAAMIGAFRIAWPGVADGKAPSGPEWETFNRLYLSAAPLDAYHTAAALRGKPVLVLHATEDKAVPAPLGDLLWERLGRPERWSSAYTHEMIFIMLPTSAGAIMDWVDAAVARAKWEKQPAPPPPAP